MDLSVTEASHSLEEFKDSVSDLLPPGDYWNPSEVNQEIDDLVEAIAIELKQTHDDTKLTILFESESTLFGWKIADYQNLLDVNGIDSTVFDKPATPNLIYIELNQTNNAISVVRQIIDIRLPHTQLIWRYVGSLNITAAVRATVYKRLELEG